ncbi:biotin-dependent enzyme [Antricoccus suffuscus]|uniref:Biotin-dependent enzyme n=1 Tax=Antricoccus suffuscus TaxID=1629062 RepID=A0A2T0ZWZ6_9ACTN|nr:biotin/lipoyl-binding carrier protein [Antricoccus suffuscus]PRZ40879.1 biotin-dependent enzyme [Antricoccus suffuscus]
MIEVRAEMTANVWKVLVAPGEEVEMGSELIILESMKMEIPVVAEETGVISALEVVEGQSVAEGDVLAVIK